MKILFTGVYPHLYGGLERFAERSVSALRAAGHEVDVVGDPPEDASGYDRVIMQKVPPSVDSLRRLKAQCGDRLRFYAHDHALYCLRRHYYDPLRRLCSRTYSFFPCRLCAAVTRPQWIARNVLSPLPQFVREMSEVRSFTTSEFVREKLVQNGFPPDRVSALLPLFAAPHREEASSKCWMDGGALRILYLGQFIAGKGVGLLVEAERLMRVPHRLTLLGKGPDEALLRRRAGPGAEFLGWRDDVQRFFAGADVLALPSLWHEPSGSVGMEALVHGVPVVAFDVGGLRDWLVPGETGRFAAAPDGDTRSPKARTAVALAAALDAMADPVLLRRMSAHCLDLSARIFNPETFVPRLLA